MCKVPDNLWQGANDGLRQMIRSLCRSSLQEQDRSNYACSCNLLLLLDLIAVTDARCKLACVLFTPAWSRVRSTAAGSRFRATPLITHLCS